MAELRRKLVIVGDGAVVVIVVAPDSHPHIQVSPGALYYK